MKNRNTVIAVIVVLVLLCLCCTALTLFAVASGSINAWLNIGSVSSSSSSSISSSSSSSIATNTQTYINSKYHFTLEYPAIWELTEDSSEVTAQFFAPATNTSDSFRENLNFSVTSVTQTPDYDTYVTELVNSAIGDPGTFELQSNDTITFMGVEARSVTYTLQSDGLDIQGSQLYFTKNNMLFIFTYTGETGEYDQYLQDANDIMASLQFN